MSDDMKKYLKIMESANTSPQEKVEEASSETCNCKKYECEICFPPKKDAEEKSNQNESLANSSEHLGLEESDLEEKKSTIDPEEVNALMQMPLAMAKEKAVDMIMKSNTGDSKKNYLVKQVQDSFKIDNVVGVLYNMILSGEGHGVVGSRYGKKFETNMAMDKVSDKDYPEPPKHKDEIDRVSDDDYADDKISDKDYPKVKEDEVEEKKATFTPPMPDEGDVVDCDDQPEHPDCNWAMDDNEIAKQLYRASPGGKAGVDMVAKKMGKSPDEVMGLLRPKMEDAGEGSYVEYVKRMLNR